MTAELRKKDSKTKKKLLFLNVSSLIFVLLQSVL